jgi:1,4-alpha-glucan branching enzyme
VVSFVRRGGDPADTLLFACNFAAVPRFDYRIGAPVEGVWTEILNSDAAVYGGSGMGNFGSVASTPEPKHGHPHSLSLTLPSLGVVAFRAPRQPSAERGSPA